jgi:hypothetical protein
VFGIYWIWKSEISPFTHHSDDGGSKLLLDYTVQHSRRQSSSYFSLWEPEISPCDLNCASNIFQWDIRLWVHWQVLWQVQHALTQWSPWLGSQSISAQWWSATVLRDPASLTAESTLTSSGPLERILSTSQYNCPYVKMMILDTGWNLVLLLFVNFAPY